MDGHSIAIDSRHVLPGAGLNIEVFELSNEVDAGAFGLLLWDMLLVPPGRAGDSA